MRLLVTALTAISVVVSACVTESEHKGGLAGTGAPAEKVQDVKASDPSPSDNDAGTSDDVDASSSVPDQPTTTCEDAHDLGAIAGDADGAQVSRRGTCSEWLRIQVNETNSLPLANPMRLKATLFSPPDVDFDLFVYVNKDQNSVECTKLADKSELPANRSDVVSLRWGEEYTGNNSDDQRPVSIEIRAKDPASCGKDSWLLVVEGNR